MTDENPALRTFVENAAAQAKLEAAAKVILEVTDQDHRREGLQDTPRRFAQMWLDFINHDPGTIDTTFDTWEESGMVVVSGIPVWSMCEHHLLPFYCSVAIGYIPHGKLLGLSKFGRIARAEAHQLHVQEDLTRDICEQVQRITGSTDVAVYARGVHLCMAMRGVQMPATMTTSQMRGAFQDNPETRDEFMRAVELAPEVRLLP